MTEGTRAIRIEADALDATVFEHTIDAIAGTLAAGTDTGAPTRRPARLAVRCDLPGVEFWSTVR